MPSAQLLLRGFERERLRRLVVERLGALHGLGAVGHGLHELGYLLVLLGELGILDGKLVDERGERVSAVAESRLTASNDIYVVLRLRNND